MITGYFLYKVFIWGFMCLGTYWVGYADLRP